MSLGVPSVLRRGPNLGEGAGPPSLAGAMQTMPPPIWPKNEAQREAREVAQREWNEQETAAKAAELERRTAEWDEKQRKQMRLEEQATKTQAEHLATKQRLQAELANARTAQSQLDAGVDCSTPERAAASIRAQALQSAAGVIVERCEAAVAHHHKNR